MGSVGLLMTNIDVLQAPLTCSMVSTNYWIINNYRLFSSLCLSLTINQLVNVNSC